VTAIALAVLGFGGTGVAFDVKGFVTTVLWWLGKALAKPDGSADQCPQNANRRPGKPS